MSNLTLAPTIDQTPAKNNSFARRGALAFTSLLAAGALAFSGASAAQAAVASGEYDIVSAKIAGSSWELGSYGHGGIGSVPNPGFEVPSSQNKVIPAHNQGPNFPLYGGGFRNESGTAAQLELKSVQHPDAPDASLEISDDASGDIRYSWDEATDTVVNNDTLLPANFHEHYDWEFSHTGTYILEFEVSSGSSPAPVTEYYVIEVK